MSPIQTTTQQITRRLRGEILAGLVGPGEPMREIGLADRFGVGRAVVRQALQNLVLEGALVSRPNCGVRVAPVQPPLVSGLLTPLRVQMELYALEKAHESLVSSEASEIRCILDRLHLACLRNDAVAILDADFEFHEWLLLQGGLEEVVPIWRSIMSRMRHHHESSNSTLDDPMVIHHIHEKLWDALRGPDLNRARKALQEHLENGAFNQDCRVGYAKKMSRRGKVR